MLGKLSVPVQITLEQGPIALGVGAGGVFGHFFWETARYRLKRCLKGPLTQNNKPTYFLQEKTFQVQ